MKSCTHRLEGSFRFSIIRFLFLFFLILGSINQLQGQGSMIWKDSCSGMFVGRVITPKLVNDSIINVCVGDTVAVQDTSIDKLQNEQLSVRYKFGNNAFVAKDRFEYVPNIAANTNLVFEIANDSGCVVTTRYQLRVQQIESQISVSNEIQCIDGNIFDFKLLHTNYGSLNMSISKTEWEVVGLFDTFLSSWNYSFIDADTIEVRVKATTDLGCISDDTLMVVTLPSARTTIDRNLDSSYCYQPLLNDSFQFTQSTVDWLNSSSVVKDEFWLYQSDTFRGDTVNWVFNPNAVLYGVQSWKHTVITDHGCKHSDSVEFYMGAPPKPIFEVVDSIVCTGQPILTVNKSIIDSKDPWDAVKYWWNSSDLVLSTSDTVEYLANTTGIKEVELYIETKLGCKDTLKGISARVSQTPEALITYSQKQVCAGDTSKLIFKATGQAKSSHISRSWFFNKTYLSSDTQLIIDPVTVSSTNYGLKPLVFKLKTSDACMDSLTIPVGVIPSPDLTIKRRSLDSCLRDVQKFSVRNAIANVPIASAIWFFEDSTQVFDTAVTKAFLKVGSQDIKVKAADIYGCEDSLVRTIQISVPPLAKFDASSLFACEDKQKFKFFDSSSTSVGNITNRTWIFSDGSVYSNPVNGEVSHNFSSAGNFKLSLGVVNSLGCVDTFSEMIQVSPKPTADFTINNSSQCLNINRFVFNNRSTSNSASSSLNYYWNFGDTTSSIATNPSKVYRQRGNYSVKLVATSIRGCSDSSVQRLTVLGLPAAKAYFNTIEQCIDKQNFEFSDSSVNNSGSGTIIQREWHFGDNSVRTGTRVTKSYATFGNYDLIFYVRLSTGCYDSLTQKITINPKPKASFTVNQDTQCITGNNFVFDNKSSIIPGGGSINYLWTFADTIQVTSTHPSISFQNYGNFKAKLKVNSQYGCIDTLELPLQVTANPLVNFSSSSPLKQCNKSDTFNFVNKTDALNGKGLSYRWAISDGSNYSSTNIGHSFKLAGNYKVTLIATNSLGCSDSSKSDITIYQDPVADFSVNQLQQCFTSHRFNTTNQSSVGFNGGNLSYRWKLGSDSINNNKDVQINNLKVGSYWLNLLVRSTTGCSDTLSRKLIVLGSPNADFDLNDSTQCLVNNSFKLDNVSTNLGQNPTYQWLFGDGTGAKTRNASKSYIQFGKYPITLIVATSDGCADTLTRDAVVHSKPTVDFTTNDTSQCLASNVFGFKSTSKNDDGSKLNYTWEFEAGKTSKSDSSTYSFGKSGTYLIKLTAISDFACTDSLYRNVVVYPQPSALFRVNNLQQCLSVNEFDFTNLSNITGNGTMTFGWDFGDGASYSGTDTSHTYATADTFKVRLIVFSNEGCSDTVNSDVIVNPQPSPNFTTTDTGFCLGGNAVKFDDNTKINSGSVKHLWYFGDGKISSGNNPVNKYNNAGRYLVKLVVTSNLGCEDSISKHITIHPNPENGYRLNLFQQCLNQNNFQFTDTTKILTGTTTVFWDFGNGQTQTTKVASVKYSAIGEYNVVQISKSGFGCTDTLRRVVRVVPNPNSNFNINDSVQCEGVNVFEFENISTIDFGKFSTKWNYGDGTIEDRFNGNYTYNVAGKYLVSQITESDQGCFDTITKAVRITNVPVVNYALNNANQCQKFNRFVATNNSTYSGTETVTYFWDLGNGDTLKQKDLSYQYPLYGSYGLTLNAVTSEGCVSRLSTNVRVNSQGDAIFDLVKDSFCLFNNLVRFNNRSRVDGDRFISYRWDFGDGNSQAVSENNPIDYSYNSAGNFTTRLITLTQNLCRDTQELGLTILPMPIATATVNNTQSCLNNQDFLFEDISTNPMSISERRWVVKKQLVSVNQSVKVDFKELGENKVSLVLEDIFGCIDTQTLSVNVLAVPTANFGINKVAQCLENNIYEFINLSTGTDDDKSFWQPEPGSVSTEFDLEYIYYKSGVFNVKLTVTNEEGCFDTIVRTVTIHPTPEGSLSYANSCIFTPVSFTANDQIASGFIKKYDWVFGDGTFANEINPAHTYNLFGRFPVSVKLTSDEGCVLLLVDSIDIYPKPEAIIGTSMESLNINQPEIQVYDESASGPFLNYEWDMGDGSDIIYDYEAIHRYEDTGWYTVKLMVESFDGCLDTGYRDFYVAPEHRFLFPTAFSPNDDGINDTYGVIGKFHSVKIAKIQIFNENGNLVFVSEDINDTWNGKLFNTGEVMNSGTYIIKIGITDSYNKQFDYSRRFNLVR